MVDSRILSRLDNHMSGELVPTQINIELTHRCNLRCVHCYLEHEADKEELTGEEWLKVLDQCPQMGILFVAFTGGEVACRSDWLDIAAEAKARGLFFHFQTNGTMIDEQVADEIKALNPTKVELSLFGDTADVHDEITGVRGSFDKTVAAAEALLQRSIRVQFKTTVMKMNWERISAIRKMAQAMGAAFQPDPMVMPGVHGGGASSSCRMGDDQFRQYMINEGWQEDPDDEFREAIRKLDNPEHRLVCAAARHRLTISPQGDAMPCMLWRIKCGNIRQQSLREIWNGEKMAGIRAMGTSGLSECLKCEILENCVRCPGLAYLETGDETKPAPESCRMSRLVHELREGAQGHER